MNVAYITNADPKTGIGNRAVNIQKELALLVEENNMKLTHVDIAAMNVKPWPGILGSKSVGWVRGGKKYAKNAKADVYDITNQTLSFLAKKLSPTVVTIHDLIELTQPQDKRAALLNKYLHSGIEKADHIIAVSKYTKNAIRSLYDVPAKSVTVIPNGVSADFFPIPNFTETIGYKELRQSLKISDESPIVLYVGSDHPRKNVVTALEAFAKYREERSNAIFIKVGKPGILSGRERTLEAIDRLQVKDSVRMLGNVSDTVLNELYNVADVLIFPSILEGFGLPPLQAMATGTPVVCSNATSLPEVVGDAAVIVDPKDTDAFVKGLHKLTEDKEAIAEYARRGLMRVKNFTWKKAAKDVLGVYKLLHK